MLTCITTYKLLQNIQNLDELLPVLKPFQVNNQKIYNCKELINIPQYVYIKKPQKGLNRVYFEDKLITKEVITKLQKIHITDFTKYQWVLQIINCPDGGLGVLITMGTFRSIQTCPLLVANYNNHMYDLTVIVKNDIMSKVRGKYSSYKGMQPMFGWMQSIFG